MRVALATVMMLGMVSGVARAEEPFGATGGAPGHPYVEMQGGVNDPTGRAYGNTLAIGPAARMVVGWRPMRMFAAEVSLLRTESDTTAPTTVNGADITEYSVDVRWFPKRFDIVEPNLLAGYSPSSTIRYWSGADVYTGTSTELGAGARFTQGRNFYMSADIRYRFVRYTHGSSASSTGVVTPVPMASQLQGNSPAFLLGFGYSF
jgi:hypothetical protein